MQEQATEKPTKCDPVPGSTPLAGGTPRDFGAQVAHQIWTTKGARFNAHRRLMRQNEWSLRAIASLSVYITVLSIAIVVPAFGVTPDAQSRISLLAAGMSLLIGVFSLLESSRNYAVRAERLHICAMQLGALLLRVAAAREVAHGVATPDLVALSQEYNAILSACQENHDDADYRLFCAQHPGDFNVSPWRAWLTRVSAPFRYYGLPAAVVIGPLLAGVWYTLR